MNNIFIAGEKIDLCVPRDSDFEQWASWFNSQEVTKYLEQGKYPNTPEKQREFYRRAIDSGRFLTMIKGKDGSLLGVISLSEIDYEKSSCQISLVCPVTSREAILAPLEAMAICTQHAFEGFGIKRVWAGQAYPGLSRWSQKLELIGYKTEGVLRKKNTLDMHSMDNIIIAVGQERFLSLANKRGGSLWPGEACAKHMISALRSENPLAKLVDDTLSSIYVAHDKKIDDIEDSFG